MWIICTICLSVVLPLLVVIWAYSVGFRPAKWQNDPEDEKLPADKKLRDLSQELPLENPQK